MRGKPVSHLSIFPGFRITPAYAGKTPVADTRRGGHGDHPRVCGENTATLNEQTGTPGSPPRMRGKQLREILSLFSGRITPAYAGKTDAPVLAFKPDKDHPRVCGENSAAQYLDTRTLRITPAYAGKTTAP